MPIEIPTGIVPLRSITTGDVLYGERITEYRWEVLTHAEGADHLVGYLDGVVEGSASLSWTLNAAVKGTGNLKVTDLEYAESGMLRIEDVALESARVRPVCVIEGLPEIALGVYLFSAAPEAWTATGREYSVELLDRSTVLDQDRVAESHTVDTTTPILDAVAAVIESAGESISVDASEASTLSSPMVWPAGTTKLQIVNDLLGALNYNSLWVDGVGNFRATPYELPARRSQSYELLNGVKRELVDGETSIYREAWSRDRDMFDVPNRVIAIQAATGDAPPLTGSYENNDPGSPFSYASRGRWITKTLEGVETPEADDATVEAFLDSRAQQSLIASSAVQASVSVEHLMVPLRVGEVMRFKNVPAGVDGRHIATGIVLQAHALGLMKTTLQEVVDL